MRVLVITSCTGQKAVSSPMALQCGDFAQGAEHLRSREQGLADLLTPARDLYTGQQHVRLMRGVDAAAGRLEVDLHVVSAGYGLVPGDRKLAPYECTFTGRGKADLKAWGSQLNIPRDLRSILARPFDLGLLLLGDDYLAACDLDADVRLGGPTLAFCGRNTIRGLPTIPGLKPVGLSNPEAKRFSCGLVGLKGEVAARLLQCLADAPSMLSRLLDPASDVLDLLDGQPRRAPDAKAHPSVDRVIPLPESYHGGDRTEPISDVSSPNGMAWDDAKWSC